MSPKTRIELLKPLGMAFATLGVCSLIFLLDHEVNGIADLLSPGVWPAYLLYGAPMWIVMLVMGYLLESNWSVAFSVLALASGASLAGIIWVATSPAATGFVAVRSLSILGALAAAMLAVPVLLIHGAVESLLRRVDDSGAALP